MESLKKNKILLSVFGITFLVFIYFMFFNGSSGGGGTSATINTDMGTSTSAGVAIQTPAGQEILQMLARLNLVQIDNDLFLEASWTSLQNFETTIPSNSPGKDDLFSPIGQSGTSLTSQTQSSKKP